MFFYKCDDDECAIPDCKKYAWIDAGSNEEIKYFVHLRRDMTVYRNLGANPFR